ncbi:MAG: pilus assembly protein [Proteobacteria bacterium]|nr:pilus assembly protein [Pseudomonadota bacterium]
MFENLRKVRAERGATLVEFSISASIIFLFIFVGVDTLRLALRTSGLQYALSMGGNIGVIRSCKKDNNLKIADNASRINAIKDEIKKVGLSYGLIIKDNDPDNYIAVCNNISTPCTLAAESPGNSKEFVRIDIHQKFPFMFQAINYSIDIHVIQKNEPF